MIADKRFAKNSLKKPSQERRAIRHSNGAAEGDAPLADDPQIIADKIGSNRYFQMNI